MIVMSKHIYFGGQAIQWIPFQIVSMTTILKSKMAVLDLLILFIFFLNIIGNCSTVKWK